MSESTVPSPETAAAMEPENANAQGFIDRLLHDHKNNKFNRDHVEVVTADYRASDGAHHKYTVRTYQDPIHQDGRINNRVVAQCDISFQDGGLKEVGPNGITDQALIAIVLDRVRSFNEGPYRCRENSMMITKLEEALMWGEKRGNDRARRNVEGERLA